MEKPELKRCGACDEFQSDPRMYTTYEQEMAELETWIKTKLEYEYHLGELGGRQDERAKIRTMIEGISVNSEKELETNGYKVGYTQALLDMSNSLQETDE